jgi:hypothetical protein
MPVPRWWEFEDARVDLGAVEAAPIDLARLLLIEFALLYANDFFVIPVELDVGSVCMDRALIVTDTFNERTLIPWGPAAAGAPWRLFNLSAARGATAALAEPLFLLAPSLGPSLQGPPLEQVLLLRDEVANLAWAVEQTVEGRAGRPIDRLVPQGGPGQPTAAQAMVDGVGAQSLSQTLAYRLASAVPANWYPLVPVQVPPGSASFMFQKRALLDPDTLRPIQPLGRIVAPLGRLLYEEEVPDEGIMVSRAYQYARWIDGSTHLWVGRRKRPGRGPGASGLRFDALEPVTSSDADVPPMQLGARATIGVDTLLGRFRGTLKG